MCKTYSDIAVHLPAFREMAKLVHLSQMIAGIKDADMAFIVLVECEMTGQTLFQWAEENHIVGNRPTMKYDAMIAAYNQLENCKFELIEKTPERCAIALTDGGKRKEFSLTWDELKKESIPYAGKESEIVASIAAGKFDQLKLKDKYATPRSRAVMMYARLVSDAIRSTRPEVTKGRYTPEEVEDFTGSPAVIQTSKTTAPASPNNPPPAVKETKTETAAVETATTAPPTGSTETPAATTTSITTQLAELPPSEMTGVTSIDIAGPSTSEQKTAILALLQQLKRDGVDLIAKVKSKLTESGIDGIAGLTYEEAEKLRLALEFKQVEEWMGNPVKGSRVNP